MRDDITMMGASSVALGHQAPAEPSRRQRRKDEVRARILAAALALFDQKEFAATTVAEICERADVAHKTFFNHFASKQHLLREIARVELDQLVTLIDRAREYHGSTADRLERFFGALADRVEEAGPMRRELMTELVHVGHEAGTQPHQARILHTAFARLLRAAGPGGLTRKHSLATLTEIVVGTFYALMFNWANFENYPFRKQAAAAARCVGEAVTGPSQRRNG